MEEENALPVDVESDAKIDFRQDISPGLNRRRFLHLSGLTAAALPLLHFDSLPAHAATPGTAATAKPGLGSWEDLYRERWSWDRVAKGSHGWLNCRSACNWNLYVKDGVVVREEQTANYEASEPGVPDFNPRGCQKGACYTEVMYGASRLTVPLKRAGERGEGKWQQISWDQALGEIAEKLISICQRYGGESIVQDLGPHFDLGATNAARNRFFGMLGASLPDDWAEIGDLNVGATLSLGIPHIGGSSDEWFLSDFLVVWMMNPAVTQMSDAHFLYEAKYNGADLTVIDPVYSATAMRADHWLPIRPGSDAALGLATARHIWESGRIDLDYVREQTDLPILVRLDTGRFLRESDLRDGGADDLLYMWDARQNAIVSAPGSQGNDERVKLFLGDIEPVIEGRFEVELADGSMLAVAPVGSLLREHLDPWTFERTAAVTGLDRGVVESFAEGFAAAERPMVLSSWGSNRYLNSDLINRSKILCLSLKGAIGKKGAGYHSTGWVGIDGFGAVANESGEGFLGTLRGMAKIFGSAKVIGMLVDRIAGKKSDALFEHELTRHLTTGEDSCLTNSASQNYKFQGLADDLAREEDHLYPQPLAAYVAESEAKGWMPTHPTKTPPRCWVSGGSNVLRRSNLPQRMLDNLWPKLELVVDVNQKHTFTGLHADYLLPAAGYYEKPGIKYSVAYVPYLHYCDKAVKPVGEAKDEWELYSLLAQEIQRIAIERDLEPTAGCGSETVNLKTLADRFSFQGEYGPEDAEGVNQRIIEKSPSAEGMTVESLKQTGIAKYRNVGGMGIQENLFNSDWKGEGVMRSLTDMSEQRWRWPTLTGRQQCYIDHPWFIDAGESLPDHKESPKAGGDHPFQFVSCHSRWSVHSVWRDTPMLLRLQRGEPVVYLNPTEAQKLGIEDGAWSKISNDYGSIYMRVKYSAMVRPKVAYYFHAWEPHQFPEHKSYKWLVPGLMKPLHFAGGEGHLGWFFGHFTPGTHVQDTRVAVEASGGPEVDAASV
jgi:DMSO reductase family type II enzyme molybdopterin subunit